jgi:hypothetical protein
MFSLFSSKKEEPVVVVPSYSIESLISKPDMLELVEDYETVIPKLGVREKEQLDLTEEKQLDPPEKPRYCIIKNEIVKYAGKFTGTEENNYTGSGGFIGTDTMLKFENKISFNKTYAKEKLKTDSEELYKIKIKQEASDNLKNHKIWYTDNYYTGQYLEDKKGLFNDQSTARIPITFNGTQLDIPAKDVAEIYGLTLEELKTKFTTRVEGGKRKTKKTKMNRKMKKQRKAKFTKNKENNLVRIVYYNFHILYENYIWISI